MKLFRLITFLLTIGVFPLLCFSQDSLVAKYARKNALTFEVNKETFTGKGWDTIFNQVKKSDFVLVAEDHFTNETPFFISAITDKVKFDNFFCEIDPYSAEIIASKIKKLSDEDLRKYVEDFGNVFSFYAMEPEFKLFKKLVKENTSMYGIDQVLMNADRINLQRIKK